MNRTQLRLKSKLLNLGAIASGFRPKPSRTQPNRVVYEACWCAYLMPVDASCATQYPKLGGSEKLFCVAQTGAWQPFSKIPRFTVGCSTRRAHINVWFKTVASVNGWTPTIPRRT